MARVTVAIPMHNAGRYIGAALESVFTQTFRDYDVVVVDDGSTDDGAEVVLSSQASNIMLVQQPNAGVAAARNRALSAASSGFVAFLDADDVWRPRHLEHLVQTAERFPSATLYANRYREQADGEEFGQQPMGRPEAAVSFRAVDRFFEEWAKGTLVLHTSSSMVSREAALAVGGFPIGHSRGEDLALMMNLAQRWPVAVSDYVGCFYRRVATGLTSRPVLSPDVAMTTLEVMLDTLPASRTLDRRAIEECYYKLALAHSFDCLLHGHDREARTFLSMARPTIWQRRNWWRARLALGMPARSRNLIRSAWKSRHSFGFGKRH